MNYVFILGVNPSLSIAEINSLLPGAIINWQQNNIIFIETDKPIQAIELMNRLGGTIKIAKVINEFKHLKQNVLIEKMISVLPKTSDNKFLFGISNYGLNIQEFKLGLEIKKKLKKQGVSSRLVTSSEKVLSSVVVTQNKLIGPGIEFLLINDNNKVVLAKTLSVQPFKELSKRDYGRPARDSRSGMLPPKIAQIMINLSQTKPGNVLLDPFCGSGTILTEAMAINYQNLLGVDSSEKAIKDTQQNINWIKKKYSLGDLKITVRKADATKLDIIKPNSIDAIITEPYLGPQRGKIDYNETRKKLNLLYSQSISEFKKVLKTSGRVVMVWPIFRESNIEVRLSPNITGFKITNPIPKSLKNNKHLKLTNRHTIIYGRSGQRVWREIVILEKK
jgi:tRNA (guanine10-N2)-dimethyltransferase